MTILITGGDKVIVDQYEEDDFWAENFPYCTCDEDPTEEEDAFNVCSACGKPLS